MKVLRLIWLAALIAAMSVLIPSVAGAATHQTYAIGHAKKCRPEYKKATLTHMKKGWMVRYAACVYDGPTTTASSGPTGVATAPYGAFGNTTIDDCQFETAANLTLAEFPSAVITTPEVVEDYNTYGSGFDISTGLFQGQDYLIDHGFDGHYAQAITPINDALTQDLVTGSASFGMVVATPIVSASPLQQQITTAANNGGVEVIIGSYQGIFFTGHMMAITAANAKGLTVVNDQFVWHYTWAQWSAAYGAANGFTAVWYYAVTWGDS